MEVGCGFKLQAASGDVPSEGCVWEAEQVLGGVVLRGDGRGEGLLDIGRGEWVRCVGGCVCVGVCNTTGTVISGDWGIGLGTHDTSMHTGNHTHLHVLHIYTLCTNTHTHTLTHHTCSVGYTCDSNNHCLIHNIQNHTVTYQNTLPTN